MDGINERLQRDDKHTFRVKLENFTSLKCTGKIVATNAFGFLTMNAFPSGIQETIS
jgi:hypothetical protein